VLLNPVTLIAFSASSTCTASQLASEDAVTVTVKLHGIAVLPLASIALYVTVVTPIGNAAPDAKLLDTEGVPQLSVAVGATHVATAVVPVV
jgi:hypothetical protein